MSCIGSVYLGIFDFACVVLLLVWSVTYAEISVQFYTIEGGQLRSLAELSARVAARSYSFQALESSYHAISAARTLMARRRGKGTNESMATFETAFIEHGAIPDKFFLSIVRWCFPESEDDVRLYR